MPTPKNPYAINFSLSKAQLEKLGTFQTQNDSSLATTAKRLLLGVVLRKLSPGAKY